MKTLVLNLDFSPLSVVSAHRGLVLSLKNDSIRVLEYYDMTFGSENDLFEVPAVLLYEKYVKPPKRKTVSKHYVLMRDNMVCQYCTKKLDNVTATIDHVVPASHFDTRVDANTWCNLVASCQKCNTKKRNRTPEQAGMSLLRKPKRPNGFITVCDGPDVWRSYV